MDICKRDFSSTVQSNPVNTDTEGTMESVRVNGVSVKRGLSVLCPSNGRSPGSLPGVHVERTLGTRLDAQAYYHTLKDCIESPHCEWLEVRSNVLSKARFRRRTFHEPDLIHWIKFSKSSASGNLERLFQFGTAQPFFSPSSAGNFAFGATLETLWFRRRTFHEPSLMHKLL